MKQLWVLCVVNIEDFCKNVQVNFYNARLVKRNLYRLSELPEQLQVLCIEKINGFLIDLRFGFNNFLLIFGVYLKTGL